MKNTRHKNAKNKKDTRTVAVAPETISVEELPFPIVYYPPLYGAFIAFKASLDDPRFVFCECSRQALSNYVQLLKASPEKEVVSYRDTRKIVDIRMFPISFINQNSAKTLDEFYEKLHFAPHICHICNNKLPSHLYCVPMYGSKFKQNFGWYENQDVFKQGIYWSVHRGCSRFIDQNGNITFIDEDNFDPDVMLPPIETARLRLDIPGFLPKWKNELLLFRVVSDAFSDLSVISHYRPEWLQGLELDIYIEEYKIAIEYQGIQHYQPVKHWGGQEGFIKRRTNDIKKKLLCEQNGVRLIYFTYQEEITYELVVRRLLPYLEEKACRHTNTP